MRLIDADKLIEDLKEYAENIKNIRDDGKCFLTEENVLSIIKEQPTAFVLDKVIQKLELLIMDEECKLIGSSKHAFKETLKKRECYKKAIDIVKVGVIDG